MGNNKSIDDTNITQFIKMRDRIDKLEKEVDELLKILRRANIQSAKAKDRAINNLEDTDEKTSTKKTLKKYLEENRRAQGHIIAYTAKCLEEKNKLKNKIHMNKC